MSEAIAIITAPDAKGMGVYKIPGVAAPFSPVHEPSAEPETQVNADGFIVMSTNGLEEFRDIIGEGSTIKVRPGMLTQMSSSVEWQDREKRPEPQPQINKITAQVPNVSVEGVNVEINGDLLRAFRNVVGEVELLVANTLLEGELSAGTGQEVDFEAVD